MTDRGHLRKIQAHYDSHANKHRSTQEVRATGCHHRLNSRNPLAFELQALQDRNRGEALPLKKLHNNIKRLLIKRWSGHCSTGPVLVVHNTEERRAGSPGGTIAYWTCAAGVAEIFISG
jgi:hypothetical protein